MHVWGAQAASLQVWAACRDREIPLPLNCLSKDVAGGAAGNYRLAACAPQKRTAKYLWNKKDLIGPRIFHFGPRGKATYIHVSSFLVEWAEDVSRFARD
jgi:hypothetical protein